MVPADVDESVRGDEDALDYTVRLANVKAAAVARLRPGAIVVAADTAVVLDGEILGKPTDRDDALRMLARLSGRTHEVLTAVAVHGADGSLRSDVRSAAVTMAAGSPGELEWYVEGGEPMDKAGAYAVQGIGAFLVERVEGDPTTVIGLPLRATLRLLVVSGLSWPPA